MGEINVEIPVIKIYFAVTIDGRVYRHEADVQSSFITPHLLRGILNGKDPADVLAYLAETGGELISEFGVVQPDDMNPEELERIGPWPEKN
jgi:hypothetical protein